MNAWDDWPKNIDAPIILGNRQPNNLTAENEQLRVENDLLRAEAAKHMQDCGLLTAINDKLVIERDTALAEIERLKASRLALCEACNTCPDLAEQVSEVRSLRERLKDMTTERDKWIVNFDYCHEDLDQLRVMARDAIDEFNRGPQTCKMEELISIVEQLENITDERK